MTWAVQNFKIRAGDKVTLPVTLFQPDGVTPYPIQPGDRVEFKLAASPGGVALIEKDSDGAEVAIVDALAGQAEIQLQPGETQALAGFHVYQTRVLDAAGNPGTFIAGQVTIEPAVGQTADDAEQARRRRELGELEDALHQLNLGLKEVQVGYDGKTVTYNQTSRAALRAAIAERRGQLGLAGGGRSRAIGMVF